MTRSDADRDKLVSELMLDAGVPGDPWLLAALESVASLSALPAPIPRGELAALLGDPSAGPDGGLKPEGDELAKRRRRKHRPALFAGVVVTAMGLGVGGVAASGGLPNNPPEFVNKLIEGWAPHANPAPQSLLPAGPLPDAPKVTVVPAPAGPPPASQPPAGAPWGPVSPSPSAVSDRAPVSAPKGKPHAAAATTKAGKATKDKPKQASANRKYNRPGESAASSPGVPAGPSGMSFKDSFDAVLDKRGPVGSTVEDVLGRIERLGIRL
ncbi:hypothetical protein [Arthrobacter silvisoli]|uniref:hypothetical protein n=1 Tax=Arthrobacter silvisoli TaxID=2291022 RepID=UPI000E211EFF|nr:hypothetical protein [Arthrobacter silvisoli]